MNWKAALNNFKHQDMLVDIYYEQMNTEGWVKVFDWLSSCPEVISINCYVPKTDQNLEYLPENIAECIDQQGFYCFTSLMVSSINFVIRFYIKSEIECDISPGDVDTEEKLLLLLNFLEKIRVVSGTPRYVVCPENYKEGAFIINGRVVNGHA
jgi:hypothetical protein